MENIVEKVTEAVAREIGDAFEESRRDFEMRLIQIEDIGWKRLYSEVDTEEGFSLESLKTVTEDLYDMVATSPMIRRAVELRLGYVYGKGFSLVGTTSPTLKNIIEDPYNFNNTLGSEATEKLMIEDAACGNAFHIKVGKGRNTKIIAVPLAQITGVITDEHDAQRVQYFQRTWVVNNKPRVEWIPLNRYVNSVRGKLPKSIASENGQERIPVSTDSVGFMYTGLRPAGWTFGIPTALAAKAWLVMYTESLQNNALLVKMLSQFAWKIMNKTGAGAKTAGATIASQRGVGGSVSMTEGQDIQAVPRGNDVNFNNVQPLAAMVASTFGVSVIALLSSPGATGGSYGAATTLDEPTLNVMSTLRQKQKAYIEEILNSLIPSVECELSFPSMTTDADYRRVASILSAQASGTIYRSEARSLILDIFPTKDAKAGLPKPDGFNIYSDPKAQSAQTGGDDSGQPSSAVSGKGKQGAVKGGTNQGDTNHDADKE